MKPACSSNKLKILYLFAININIFNYNINIFNFFLDNKLIFLIIDKNLIGGYGNA